MHESSLARKLLDAALERTHEERIVAVHGWIADAEALSAESLAFHFAAHARNTRAEGAQLKVRIERIAARCKGCGEHYAPEHHVTLCPSCGCAEAQLLGRSGIGIDAIDVEPERT
jgi:hydrogenase nickel incorporation protein HypA/HybF